MRLASLYTISTTKDVTWENPLAAIWSSVEANTGILCSCLPTLRSVFTRLFPRLLGSFRSSPHNSGEDSKQKSGESGGSSSADGTGVEKVPGCSDRDKNKQAYNALTRDLSGWGDTTQTSHIRSSGVDRDSMSEIDLDDLGPHSNDRPGRIHVTTVMEQDVEQAAGAACEHDTESFRSPTPPINISEHWGGEWSTDRLDDPIAYRPRDRTY